MKKRIILMAIFLAFTAVITVGCKKAQESPKDSNSQEKESEVVLPEQELDEEEQGNNKESGNKEESNKKEESSSGVEEKDENEEKKPQISDGKIELPTDQW